jgi:hypothetical protein
MIFRAARRASPASGLSVRWTIWAWDVMTDPVMLSVASALAGKAAESALAGAQSACAALVRTVRERFGRDKEAAAALDAACSRPDDGAAVAELAAALERVAATDASFAAQLRGLWPRVSQELSAREGGVVSSVTGTVGGHLIQARDLKVDGGLHLGDVRGPERS